VRPCVQAPILHQKRKDKKEKNKVSKVSQVRLPQTKKDFCTAEETITGAKKQVWNGDNLCQLSIYQGINTQDI
jgi:hypothetical protein